MRIALAQIQAGTDPSANLGLVEEYTRRAADAGARSGAVPRGHHVPIRGVAGRCRRTPRRAMGRRRPGYRGPRRHHRRRRDVRARRRTRRAARVTNTLIAAGPGVDAHYDKIHLYDAFGFTESRTVAPGHEPVVITVDGVGVGLTLCYDIRFPELYVELARRGAKVITVHASWGTGAGQARAVDAAGPRTGAGHRQLRGRGRSGVPGRRDRRDRTDRGRRQRGGVPARRSGRRRGRRPVAARHRYRHRRPCSRSGTRSLCCATAQTSLMFIGQNRERD